MGYGIILYVYIISLLTKNVPTIIYFPAIFSIKILSQMLIVSLVFYFKTNKYICVFILFVIKFYKKITIFVKYIQINKFLLYNKLAIIHISFYLVTLIYLFHYQINTHKYKFNITYFILITFILGILWSSQEVLWGGFWNWNLIELSILFILLIFIYLVHNKIFKLQFLNIIFLIVFVYLYYNHIPLVLSIHNFTNNPFLKTTFLFLLPLYFYFAIYKTNIYFLIVIMFWWAQIFVDNTNVTVVYRSVLVTNLFFFSSHNIWILPINYLLFVHVLLIKILNFFIFKRKFIFNSINILNHYIIFFLIFVLIILQIHYNIMPPVSNIINHKQHFFAKNKFCSSDIFFLKKKKLIWRYKINISFINNYCVIKYF